MVGIATNALEHIQDKEVIGHSQVALSVVEKVGRVAAPHRKDIVIEIEIFLVEPLNAMQMHLDRVAIENWEMLLGDNIFVKHNIYLVTIYPFGHLAVVRNNKVNLTNKRHILGYTPKKVAQSTPIAKTLLQHRLVGELFVVALPYRVQTVYICNNYIHFLPFTTEFSSLPTTNIAIYFLDAKSRSSKVEKFLDIGFGYRGIKIYDLLYQKLTFTFVRAESTKV